MKGYIDSSEQTTIQPGAFQGSLFNVVYACTYTYCTHILLIVLTLCLLCLHYTYCTCIILIVLTFYSHFTYCAYIIRYVILIVLT